MSIALPVRRHCQGDPSAFGHQSARGINSVLLVHGDGYTCVEGHGRVYGPLEHHARAVRGEDGLGRRQAGEVRWV
jgi:hypothetical protein